MVDESGAVRRLHFCLLPFYFCLPLRRLAFLLHFKQYVGQLRRDVEEDAARAVVLVGRDRLRRLVCARRDALKHLVLAFESLRESEVAFELVESVAHRVHVCADAESGRIRTRHAATAAIKGFTIPSSK